MKERANELEAEARRAQRGKKGKADGERDVLANQVKIDWTQLVRRTGVSPRVASSRSWTSARDTDPFAQGLRPTPQNWGTSRSE
jgi:hypothetical protein